MRKSTLLLAALVFGWLALLPLRATVQASPIFIDDFRVTKNAGLAFADPFDNGVPPPSAPNFVNGEPASYFVNGTLNEAVGKVRLDKVGADITSSIVTGQSFFIERALLLTNIDPTNLVSGLKIDDTFSVQGLFDLSVPTENLEFYGIRLTDGTAATVPNDIVQLGVRRGTDGVDRLEFARLGPGTIEFFGNLVLDPSHDQILFDLTRASTGNNAITGSFAYVDGGVVGPFATYVATADIFRGENFTRAEFVFFTPAPEITVPEPASLILLGTGLAALAVAGWRRSRRH
jgi:hypothetical protein